MRGVQLLFALVVVVSLGVALVWAADEDQVAQDDDTTGDINEQADDDDSVADDDTVDDDDTDNAGQSGDRLKRAYEDDPEVGGCGAY